MNRLFIELYLDEDVDVLVADLLRSRGFVVVPTVEAKKRGATDAEQLAYAVESGYVLFTHNRVHFENLAREYIDTDRLHHGIIIATRRRPHDLVRRLLRILNHVTADELDNQVRYI